MDAIGTLSILRQQKKGHGHRFFFSSQFLPTLFEAKSFSLSSTIPVDLDQLENSNDNNNNNVDDDDGDDDDDDKDVCLGFYTVSTVFQSFNGDSSQILVS